MVFILHMKENFSYWENKRLDTMENPNAVLEINSFPAFTVSAVSE